MATDRQYRCDSGSRGGQRRQAHSVHFSDSAPFGTADEKPGFAAADALPAEHLDRDLHEAMSTPLVGIDAPNLSPAVISRLTAAGEEEYSDGRSVICGHRDRLRWCTDAAKAERRGQIDSGLMGAASRGRRVTDLRVAPRYCSRRLAGSL
jgi:hypothetical protein